MNCQKAFIFSLLLIILLFLSCLATGGHYQYFILMHHRCNEETIERLTLEEWGRPQDWRLNYWRGFCYAKSKDYHKAIKDFHIAFKKNPSKKEIIDEALCWIYFYLADEFNKSAQYDSASYYYSIIFETKNPMTVPKVIKHLY